MKVFNTQYVKTTLNNDFVNVINHLKFVNTFILRIKIHTKSIGIYNFVYLY